MRKSKKIAISLIASLIILTVSVQWLLGQIADRHISKSIIIEQLEKVTGYHVTIQGPLHWHFSLHPSLGIEKVTFSSGKETVIVVDNANLHLHLLTIFNPAAHSEDVDFSFKHWQQNQVHFSNGSTHITYKNKQLILSQFSAQFYQGHVDGDAHIDLRSQTPKISIIVEASQVEISTLLADITGKALFTGKAHLKANLTSQGGNAAQFIAYLNGTVALQAKEGELNTIQLDPAVKKKINVFDTLEINATIENGIANTISKISAKNYHSNGKGTVNLIKQTLALHFDTYYDRLDETKKIAVPVDLSGSITDPDITINLSQSIQQFLNSDKKSLKNKFHQIFG